MARTTQGIRHLRFSIAGLFIVVAGAALGFAYYNNRPDDWPDALLAAATFWVVVGVCQQIGDLWRDRRRWLSGGTEHRWGWRLSVAWRPAMIVLVVATFVTELLIQKEVIATPQWDNFTFDLYGEDKAMVRGIFYLALGVMLGSTEYAHDPSPRRKGLRSLQLIVGLVLGCALAAIVCLNVTMITYLVGIGLQGIEMSQPLKFAYEGIDPRPGQRGIEFLKMSTLGVAIVGIAVVSINCYARARRNVACWLWGTGALGGLCGVAVFDLWLYFRGLPGFSPEFAEAYLPWPFQYWILGALLIVLLAGIAAFRATVERREPSAADEGSPMGRATPYLNARPVVALLIAVAILGQMVYPFVRWQFDSMDFLYTLLFPLSMVQCGVMILAFTSAFAAWRRRSCPLRVAPVPIRPWRLLTTWALLIPTLAGAIIPLTALCFSMWYLLGYT